MNPLPVFLEDDYLLVIDKPAGLVAAATTTQSGPTLADILKTDFGIELDRGGLVHRLDKNTSGVMVVAKTQPILEALQAEFKDRVVKKEYLCLVHGQISEEGVINGPISRNPGDREKFIVSPDGKPATTNFLRLKKLELSDENISELYPDFSKIQLRRLESSNYKQFCLVRVFPQTGRTHQIRVHLKYINHPIVGDEKYAGRKISRLDHRWCARQFLHAAKLEFIHPVTQERVSFESPLPEDLEKALALLSQLD